MIRFRNSRSLSANATRAAMAISCLLGVSCGSPGTSASSAPVTTAIVVPYDIDANTFRTGGSVNGEVVVVVGSQPTQITAALTSAGERFMDVNERGHEYTAAELNRPDETDGEGVELYTPNYVSEVTAASGGLSIYVDCKGEISKPMGERFMAILVEELQRAGVIEARIFSPPQ